MSDSNPLLNNVSVQGAAKSIEGLMDSKGVIKKPQAEATPVEPGTAHVPSPLKIPLLS